MRLVTAQVIPLETASAKVREDIVEALEVLLADAKAGHILALAIATVERPEGHNHNSTGELIISGNEWAPLTGAVASMGVSIVTRPNEDES